MISGFLSVVVAHAAPRPETCRGWIEVDFQHVRYFQQGFGLEIEKRKVQQILTLRKMCKPSPIRLTPTNYGLHTKFPEEQPSYELPPIFLVSPQNMYPVILPMSILNESLLHLTLIAHITPGQATLGTSNFSMPAANSALWEASRATARSKSSMRELLDFFRL